MVNGEKEMRENWVVCLRASYVSVRWSCRAVSCVSNSPVSCQALLVQYAAAGAGSNTKQHKRNGGRCRRTECSGVLCLGLDDPR